MTGRTFAPAEDRIILAGQAAGLSWTVIGNQIGTTGKACQYRLARTLQLPDPKVVQVGRSKSRHPPEEKQKRDALAAGADATWRAITAGIVLDGSAYG